MASLLIKLLLLAAITNPAKPAPVYSKPTIFTVPIVTYHHVGLHKGIYYVAPIRFEQELAYLMVNDFHTISMNTYADYLEDEKPLPGKPAILTFDDGYDDAYTMVYPLL